MHALRRFGPWSLLLMLAAAPLAANEIEPIAEEKHFASLRQLTFGGVNAEAYFAPDGKRIAFQATREGDKADQIYVMDLETGKVERVSSGQGRTTCSYLLPDGRILYSSTHHHGVEPPTPPDRSHGYVWPLCRTYDIFLADPKTGETKALTDNDGYDAEATVSPDGKRVIFTSHRDKGIWMYTMNVDGTDVRRVEHRWGYVGGPFFSPDGQWIVYRSYYPQDETKANELASMLEERLLRPKGMDLEIYVAKPDGSEERAVTQNHKINFAPFFYPDGKRIIYSSNQEATHPGHYSLYVIGLDGTGNERVSHHTGFDGFPCFSPDGKKLLFISDRNAKGKHELNIFLAEWKD